MLAMRTGSAEEVSATKDCPPGENEWKLDFVKDRFSKFVDVIDKNVDVKTREKMISQFGRVCGQESFDQLKKYVGDIDGLLNHIQNNWAEKAEYDREKGEIRVVGKPTKECFCPFVATDQMSDKFCSCSAGWSKEVFQRVLGKKVETEMTSTVLRGDERCTSVIRVLG
jgi:predicted ArsR family transcriptional regulator